MARLELASGLKRKRILVTVTLVLLAFVVGGVVGRFTSTTPLHLRSAIHGTSDELLRSLIHLEIGKVRSPLAYRIVSFHKGRADKRLIRLAQQLGFNGVQIQLEGSTVEGIKQFVQREKSEHLVEFCHGLGMKVTLWVHELSDVPAEWMPEWLGPVTAENAGIWSLLDERYEWVLHEAVPNIDGLVLTVVETQIRATDTPVMVKLVKLLQDKCSKYNKTLMVRTFAWYPEELTSMLAAVEQMPADTVIMSKVVPQDWQMRGANAGEIGQVGGRPQIVEYDVCGEYFLRDRVANCMVDLLKRQFDYGLAKGVSGICVRVDREDSTVLHEPNEVNLWALGMLAGGASDNLEEIWRAWAINRFGKEAADGVVKALGPSREVVAELLSIGPFTFGDTRAFPLLGDEDVFGDNWQNWWWDKSFGAAHEKAEVGEAGFVAEVESQKARAKGLARQCLLDLESVRGKLKKEDYEILKTRLATNEAQLAFRTPMALAVLHYRQMMNAKEGPARGGGCGGAGGSGAVAGGGDAGVSGGAGIELPGANVARGVAGGGGSGGDLQVGVGYGSASPRGGTGQDVEVEGLVEEVVEAMASGGVQRYFGGRVGTQCR